MIQRDGTGNPSVKVLDFGIAKLLESLGEKEMTLTQKGGIIGTPLYMSPEQASSEEIDGRSDMYSLGIVMYEMLSGQVPFHGKTVSEILLKHIRFPAKSFCEIAPLLKVPREIEQVVLKAISKEKGERFQNALEFKRACENLRELFSGGLSLSLKDPPPKEKEPYLRGIKIGPENKTKDPLKNGNPYIKDPRKNGKNNQPKISKGEKKPLEKVKGWRERLDQEIRRVVSSIATENKKENSLKVVMDQIICTDTGLAGPFSVLLHELLEKYLKKHSYFILIEHELRGIKITGPHTIRASYRYSRGNLLCEVSFYSPDDNLIKKYPISLSNVDKEKLPSMIPSNYGAIKRSIKGFRLKGLSPKSTQTVLLKLEMTTNRGKEGATFKHGEYILLQVWASRDCYLHIYYLQADGSIVQIFPNSYHKSNKIEGGRIYTIGGKDYSFNIEVDCSQVSGSEIIKAVASLKPLPEVPGEALGIGYERS